MNFPANLQYTKDHEWIQLDGNVATIGITDFAQHELGDIVYVSIDADGFDPSIVPAVGTAEPGGLSWQQGTKLLKRLCERKKIVGFDIVEIAPREVDIISEFAMAKLCYKFLGYLNTNNHI